VEERERDLGWKALPEFSAFFELLTKFVANRENEKKRRETGEQEKKLAVNATKGIYVDKVGPHCSHRWLHSVLGYISSQKSAHDEWETLGSVDGGRRGKS